MGALLFLPAGTLRWREAWVLLGILFVPMFCAGLVMFFRSPDLLRRRLNAKEKEADQKAVIAWSGLLFLCSFVLAGLAVRFSWPMLPAWAGWCAAVLFLASYALYAEVLRENVWLSRTIEVQEGQKVVDTGLYGVVRHPMYAATLILFLSMPLVLRAPLSFLVLLGYLPVIVKRIRGEEAVLARELPGYPEYMRKVRFRLIPGVW